MYVSYTMARSVDGFMLPLCGVIVILTFMCGGRSPVSGAARSLWSSGPCGDGLCLCTGRGANCSGLGRKLTYIPRFPDGIIGVTLSNNNLTSGILTENFFANLTNISILDLSNNNFSWLPRAVFGGMKHLSRLNLTANTALELDSVKELLSLPALTTIWLEECHLPPPPADFFPRNMSRISIIKLNYNPHGGVYSLQSFCALNFLIILELSHCDFNDIFTSCPLQKLSILALEVNSLTRFPKTCMGTTSLFPHLQRLLLSYNRIQILSTAEVCLPSLRTLDLAHNFIKFYATGTFNSFKFPLLEELRLYDQSEYWYRGKARVEDYAFDNENLEELDFGYTGLRFDSHQKVGRNAFANCSRLKFLHLHSNDFTSVNEERFLQLFGHLHSLVVLSMPDSQLERISVSMFARFPDLEELYLERNIIADVPDGAFDSLPKLQKLFLHNNNIKTVNRDTFNEGVRERLSSLTLGSNPFFCSCDLLWFAHWYQTETRTLFQDKTRDTPDYKCQNMAGTALANFSMTEQACLLSREVNLALLQFCGVFILTLTLVCLLFRYRWYIRLLMYEVFRGRDILRRQRLQENNFDFDVFVSYASEDVDWVWGQLVVKLEEDFGLRLCIHQRDFVPGRNIVDNVVQCVESSKKVLMVYSDSFVRSPWCQFELSLCLSHVLDYDDALIVVCVDEVTSRQMTSSMMAVLKTTTYIQWREEEEEAVASFWGRLHLAFREILPHNERYV